MKALESGRTEGEQQLWREPILMVMLARFSELT